MVPKLERTEEITGRLMEEFSHTDDKEWGYEVDRTDWFIVLHPINEEKGKKYPLFMTLHSAGHGYWNAAHSLAESNNHDLFKVDPNAYMVFLDNTHGGKEEYWWGGVNPQEEIDETKLGTAAQPVEKRCIGTTQWVMENYPIDKDMVYAIGISMGGSGTLATAMPRGDIFAAIKVCVPAGVRAVAERCAFGTGARDDLNLPDPPPVIEYSAQNDNWSKGHGLLYTGMKEKKYALMSYWGNFGHDASDERIPKVNDLINTFDLLTIKKNCAYPVFTNCDADDAIPWLDESGMDHSGQMNAYFRWNVARDTETELAIELWLVTAEEIGTRFTVPDKATVDVSLRRMQNLTLPEGEFTYTFGDTTGKGSVTDSLPTVEKLVITNEKQTLVIKK